MGGGGVLCCRRDVSLSSEVRKGALDLSDQTRKVSVGAEGAPTLGESA